MDAKSAESSSETTSVNQLVAECLAQMAEHGPESLKDFCSRHPHVADRIEERVLLLQQAGLLEEEMPDESDAAEAASFPQRLGDFKLLKRISRGGMGVVYLARQLSLQREVALKLIRPDQMFFPGARRRFRREVDAVSRLQHPGIVPILMVGEEQGIPYFVMPRIPGCTLGDVLQQFRRKSLENLAGRDFLQAVRSRLMKSDLVNSDTRFWNGSWQEICLRLSRQVAAALEHAHRHGVMHRDIKPSNIMVTPDGQALLLDFGLASAEGSMRITQPGTQLGSLAYMSPEQVHGHRTVDQRTDIYSLGLTLYELLTLQCPFLLANSQVARQRILEGRVEPIRSFNPAVSLDTETACMKAMNVQVANRYPHSAEFLDDINRILNREPILARRPGTWQNLRNWASRNPSRAAAGVLAVLLFGIAPLAWGVYAHHNQRNLHKQTEEAKRETARAERISELLLNLFESPHLQSELRHEVTLGEALDLGAAELFKGLPEDRKLQTKLLHAMGRAYLAAGRHERGKELLQQGLQVAKQLGDSYVPIRVEILRGLAWAAAGNGNRSLQAGYLDSAQALAQTHQLDSSVHLFLKSDRVEMRIAQNPLSVAEPTLTDLHREFKTQNLTEHREYLHLLQTHANLYASLFQFEKSEQLYRQILRRLDLVSAHRNIHKLSASLALAFVLRQQDKLDDAETVSKEALRQCEVLFRNDHPLHCQALINWSDVLARRSRHTEAEQHLREALRMSLALNGKLHQLTALAKQHLATSLHALEKNQKALALQQSAVDLYLKIHGEDHLASALSLVRLGNMLQEMGQLPEMANLFAQHLPVIRKHLPAQHPDMRPILENTSWVLLNLEEFERAEPIFAVLNSSYPDLKEADPENWALNQTLHGRCLAKLDRFDEAERYLLNGCEYYLGDSQQMTHTRNLMAQFYTDWNKPEEAARWRNSKNISANK